MKNKFKHPLFLTAFGVTLFAGLLNLGTVFGFIGHVFSIMSPVLIGFILAFILNVPMRGFEKIITKLTGKLKKKPSEKTVSFISMLLTLLTVFLIIFIVITSVIPAITESIISLYNVFKERLPQWLDILREYDIDSEMILDWMESLNLEELIKNISSNATSFISYVVTFATTAVSEAVSFLMSLIIAIYALLCKRDLSRQIRKLADAHMKPSVKDYLYHVCELINTTYSKFLSGQCVEACILGILIFISFTIADIPYASLVGVLTTVFAFIPFIGAFLSCSVGAVLVLIADPSKVIVAIIVYLVVQFIENQFIYPHVVGTSVGLSSLWTLVAVLLGGNLFGVIGIIFFIPVTAVLITLLREHTNHVLEKKKLSAKDDGSSDKVTSEEK